MLIKKNLFILFILIIMLISSINIYAADQYTENLIPQMTSNTSPSGIASAGESWTNTPAWKAFDKNVNYYDTDHHAWGTTKTYGWLAYEFSTPQIITKYTIVNTIGASLLPKNWTFEAWDGTQWIVLDTRTNISNWVSNVKQEFTFNNVTAYNKYRINISANNGSTSNTVNLSISELEMMGSVSPTISIPSNLTTAVGNDTITVSWDAVNGATGYDVEINGLIIDNVSVSNYVYSQATPNTQYTFRVRAKDVDNVSEWSQTVTVTTPDIITSELDIQADKYTMFSGEEFTADVVIRNAQGIYAEDITVNYDPAFFEYIGAAPVDASALQIYHSNTSNPGTLRYIVASKGEQFGLNGDSQILRLTFKVTAARGESTITTLNGLIADGDGNEYEPLCLGKTFIITSSDVNGDEQYTLGDLAIAGRYFNTSDSSLWGTYKPDVDVNGTVENTDLDKIVSSILQAEQL